MIHPTDNMPNKDNSILQHTVSICNVIRWGGGGGEGEGDGEGEGEGEGGRGGMGRGRGGGGGGGVMIHTYEGT